MAGTDFSHLTNDELIKGIQALKLPEYIRSKGYGVDVRETLAQMTEMTIQLGVNMGLSPDDALEWARKLQGIDAKLAQKANQIDLIQTNTEVNGLDQRIDNLVVPISAENANIEVTDSRTSVEKGISFATLTERLEQSEKETSLDVKRMNGSELDWELGTISNGTEGVNEKRIRTTEYYSFPSEFAVHVKTGFKVGIQVFNEDEGFVEDTGWLSGAFKINTTGKFFRFVISKEPNAVIEASEIPTIISGFTLSYSEHSKRLDDNDKEIISINSSLDEINSKQFFTQLDSGEWEQGTIYKGNNDENEKRIRTKDFLTFNYGALVKPEAGYIVGLTTYDSNGSFINDTGWLDSLEIPARIGNKYRLVLGKKDISEIVPSESANVKIILNDVDYEKHLTDKVKQETLDEIGQPTSKIPEYFIDEISDTSKKIKINTTEKSLIFPIITDSHINENRKSDFKITCNNIKELGKKHSFDGLLHLGDMIDGNADPVSERDYINHLVSELKNIDSVKSNMSNLFLLKGNHDDISYGTNIADGTTLSDGELYSKIHRHNEVGVERTSANSYYYKDFDSIGIRFIFLNSIDVGYGMNVWGYSQTQVDWVTNVALNTDYDVLVLTHNPLLGTFNLNTTPIQGATAILNALESWQTTDKRVICVISGHSHADNVDETSNSFPHVLLGNNKFETLTNIPTGAVAPSRERGTVTHDLWDVMILKLDSKKVKFVRFGAGEDKEVSYGV